MSVIEVRRHTMRSKPGHHLSQAGVRLARELGNTLGPFDQVITSTVPRAYETALAMGYAVDQQLDMLSQMNDAMAAELPWPFSFAQAAQAVARGGPSARFAQRMCDLWRGIAQRLPVDGRALIITHGGLIEAGAVGCLPDADHERWGAACDYMEGVRLSYEDGTFVAIEVLRVGCHDARLAERIDQGAPDLSTPRDLVERLKANLRVVGLVRYGGRTVDDSTSGGDFDLFAIVAPPSTEVEGIHFHVGGIPVDLSVRTMDDLALDVPVSFMDRVLLDGEILFDPTWQVAAAIREVSISHRWSVGDLSLTKAQVAWERFCQKHVLDKVAARLDSHRLLSAFLMHTNIYWLVQTYFRVRELPYPGEKPALEWLAEHDADWLEMMERFYATADPQLQYQLTVWMTARALEPVGGAWRSGEVLALGRHDGVINLQAQGRLLYQELVGDGGEDS